jgi:hypothetical protein
MQFPNRCVFLYLEFRTLYKVQKRSDSECVATPCLTEHRKASIVTGVQGGRLEDSGFDPRYGEFFLCLSVRTASGSLLASCTMGIAGCLLGDKTAGAQRSQHNDVQKLWAMPCVSSKN